MIILKKYVNLLILVIVIISVAWAIFVRNTFIREKQDLLNYNYISLLSNENFIDILNNNNILDFQDIYEMADLVVLANYNGQNIIYESCTMYTLKVEKVIKGNLDSSENINVLEYTAINHQNKTFFGVNGSIPFNSDNQYILLLNEQKQHGNPLVKKYYITTESPLGKYMLNSTFLVKSGSDLLIKDLYDKSLICDSEDIISKYTNFYTSAKKLLE